MLDMDQIMALPGPMRERYQLLEKLFEHPGFKFLKEWAVAQVNEQTARILNATSWDQHLVARGAQLAYQNFVNVEELTHQEFAAMAAEAHAKEVEELFAEEVAEESVNE